MKKQDFILYKKELNALRKTNIVYAKEVLAFAKKTPNNEHLVLSSCLLINDSEKFFGNHIPLKKPRPTKNTRPILSHPLKAWESYENALAEALKLDGKQMQTLQKFDGENIIIDILTVQEAKTEDEVLAPVDKINDVLVEEALNVSEDTLNVELIASEIVLSSKTTESSNEFYQEDPIELVSDAVELIDNIANEEPEAFAHESVEPIKENNSISENVNLSVSKEYVAPEELTVDNSIEDKDNNVAQIVETETKPSSMSSGGFNLKSKEYVAPEELTVDNHIEASNVIDRVSDDGEIIHTVDTELSVDANLDIHEKEYSAPEELTIDNSIKVQNIIVNPKKVKPKRRGLFEKKIKPVDYSGVHEDSGEVKEYTRNDKLDLFSVEDEATDSKLSVDEKPQTVHVNERTLAEANEYVVGSDADLTLKSKEYSAPEELIVDNRLPEAATIVTKESADTIYVDTVDNAIESNTEIRIKSKEYVAPEELVVDNSITEEEVEPKVKRGLFSRKRKEAPEAKVQPVVFLPPKPIDFEIPEAPEEGFVYKRKSNAVQDIFIEDVTVDAVKKEDVIEDDTASEAEYVVEDKYDIVINNEAKAVMPNSLEINFDELAEELAKEKLAKEQVVYAKDKHVKKSTQDVNEIIDEVEELEDKDDYLEKQKNSPTLKTSFDTSSIIKDIKIIDI